MKKYDERKKWWFFLCPGDLLFCMEIPFLLRNYDNAGMFFRVREKETLMFLGYGEEEYALEKRTCYLLVRNMISVTDPSILVHLVRPQKNVELSPELETVYSAF